MWVMEKKRLDDDDVAALARVRKLLCIPKDVVDSCTQEICGAVYKAQVQMVGRCRLTPD